MSTTAALLQYVPASATHALIEERQHRGQTVYAVLAIVPGGSSVPLNGYSTFELAASVAEDVAAYIGGRS